MAMDKPIADQSEQRPPTHYRTKTEDKPLFRNITVRKEFLTFSFIRKIVISIRAAVKQFCNASYFSSFAISNCTTPDGKLGINGVLGGRFIYIQILYICAKSVRKFSSYHFFFWLWVLRSFFFGLQSLAFPHIPSLHCSHLLGMTLCSLKNSIIFFNLFGVSFI